MIDWQNWTSFREVKDYLDIDCFIDSNCFIEEVDMGVTCWDNDKWYSRVRAYSGNDIPVGVTANLFILECIPKDIKSKIKENYGASEYVIVISEWDMYTVSFYDDLNVAKQDMQLLENSEKPFAEDYAESIDRQICNKIDDVYDFRIKFDEERNEFIVRVDIDDRLERILELNRFNEYDIDEIVCLINFKNDLKDKYNIKIVECAKQDGICNYEITIENSNGDQEDIWIDDITDPDNAQKTGERYGG